MKTFDAVIVGGGPGGLAGALALGRGRASTLVLDGGTPRNARAHEMHNFLSRDGTPPKELRAIGREQLRMYENVEVRDALVTAVSHITGDDGARFEVHIGEERVRARRILLTTGVRDLLPELPGLDALWGRTVFQCPYCHGWELRDRPWGLLVMNPMVLMMGTLMTAWASKVTVFSNGVAVPDELRATWSAVGVELVEEPVTALHGTGDAIESVEVSGRRVAVEALIFHPKQEPSPLVRALGLALDDNGAVKVQLPMRESSVPGVHVAGDAMTMMQSAIMAASEGTAAAAMMNHLIVEERVTRRATMRT